MPVKVCNKEVTANSFDIGLLGRAKKLGINVSGFVNKALREEVERQEREKKKK